MKSFNAAAKAEISAGTAIVQGAVWVGCDPEVAVWGGYETLQLVIDGVPRDFLGVGDRGLIVPSSAALGGAAGGLDLKLSGIDPAALELLDADDVAKAPVIVLRLIFSGDGRTLLDYHVFDRGRADLLPSDETIGGTATITIKVETAARGLGRRGGRMRSDADQRLIDPPDGFFKNAAFAGAKTLYWGGTKPATAGSAIGGTFGGGIKGGGGDLNLLERGGA